MRAFLIDPIKRSISEIDLVRGDEVGIQIEKILQCRDTYTVGISHEHSYRLNGSEDDGGDTLLVDNSYLRPGAEYRDEPPVWFQVDPGRKPAMSAAIPVLSLVIGCDQIGNYTDARISLEELTKRIVFWPRVPFIDRA